MRPHLPNSLCRLVQEAHYVQRIVSPTPSQAADPAVEQLATVSATHPGHGQDQAYSLSGAIDDHSEPCYAL